MFILIVAIGIIALISYFLSHDKNSPTNRFGACAECKNCRIVDEGYFCIPGRHRVSIMLEKRCCEKAVIDDNLIEEVVFEAIDLNYDGKHYVRQKLYGRKYDANEVDAVIKDIASNHPEFLSSYRPSTAIPSATSQPIASTQPSTARQPQPVSKKPEITIPLSCETDKSDAEVDEDIDKVSEDPSLLDDFKKKAEAGDAAAAYVVAMICRGKKEFAAAYKWSCMAAEKGYFRGICSAAELTPFYAHAAEKVVGTEEALSLYEKGMMYFEAAKNHSDAAMYPQLVKMLDEEVCGIIVMYMGECLLRLRRYAEVKDVLLKRERQGKSTNELSILLGYACFYLDEDREAYSHLRVIERADKLGINHQFIEAAYEMLAVYYRGAPSITGIVGKQAGAEAAYRLISRAAAQPDEVGQWGREELKKYRKNQFGSYEYIG